MLHIFGTKIQMRHWDQFLTTVNFNLKGGVDLTHRQIAGHTYGENLKEGGFL